MTRAATSFATAEEEGDVVSVTLAGESPLDAAAALAGTGDGGGGGDAKAESALRVALRIVSDRRMAAVLGAVWVANASISCLEANIGAYLQQDMGFSVSASGLTYIVTALPSVAASFVAGSIGNRCGRWQTVAGGLILQGLFYALSPKSNMWVECVVICLSFIFFFFVNTSLSLFLEQGGSSVYHSSDSVWAWVSSMGSHPRSWAQCPTSTLVAPA